MATEHYGRVKFGGTITKKDFKTIKDAADETFDGAFVENGFIEVDGWAFPSDIESFESLLKQFNLHYIFTVDPISDNEGYTTYSSPDMDEPVGIQSDMNGRTVVRTKTIKPFINLALDIIKMGRKALPLHASNENEDMRNLISKLIDQPHDTQQILTAKFEELVPGIPDIPPINIVEGE